MREPQIDPRIIEALLQQLAEQNVSRQAQQYQYGQSYPNAVQGGQVNPMSQPQFPMAQGEPYDPNGWANYSGTRVGGRMGSPTPVPDSATPTAVQGEGPSGYANDAVNILGRLGLPEDHLSYGPYGSAGTFAEARQRGQEIGLSPLAPDLMASGLAFGREPGIEVGGVPGGIEGAVTSPQDPMSQSAAKPKKKKGEYSDFFKALTAAKKGDKNVKKSFSELAKQLETEVAPEAKATGTPTI